MYSTKKILLIIVAIVTISIGSVACQPTVEGPQIQVTEAWGRPSPMAAGNGAAYMTIENTGSEDDTLIKADSDVSEVVELHDMTMEDDIMKMFQVENIAIPAGGTADLKPGSKHIMFIGLYDKLEAGQMITITLEFEKSGTQTVEVEIREE